MNNNHLLITGIPGTGKSCIAEYLRAKENYELIDFETNEVNTFLNNPDTYTKSILKKSKVVINWGFLPYQQAHLVKNLKLNGFKLIWLDGDRISAFREFEKRGTVSADMFMLQMWNITSSNVIDYIQPMKVNPFNDKGEFKLKEEIVKEILSG